MADILQIKTCMRQKLANVPPTYANNNMQAPIVQWYNSQPINKDRFRAWLQCLQACICLDGCCQQHNSLFLLLSTREAKKKKRSDSLVLLTVSSLDATWTKLYLQFPNPASSLTVTLPLTLHFVCHFFFFKL